MVTQSIVVSLCLLAKVSSALVRPLQDLRSKAGLSAVHSVPLSTGAACLDGSNYAYAIAPGDPKQWTIQLDGPGECWDEAKCEERSRTEAGTSKSFTVPESAEGDCTCMNYEANGDAAECTCVDLHNCDGGYFTGHFDEPFVTSNGTKLMIRGRRNLEVAIRLLVDFHGLGNASHVVVSGQSSGGLATFLNLDRIRSLIPSGVRVQGVPKSGFTLAHKTIDNEDYYVDRMSMVFHFHNSIQALSPDCLAEYHDSPWLCMVVQHAGRFIETPLFVMNSMYDAWQLNMILGLNRSSIYNNQDGTGSLLPVVLDYGKDFMKEFNSFWEEGIKNERYHGAFIQSCICHAHCYGAVQHFQGSIMRKNLGHWYHHSGEGAEPAIFVEQDEPNYECACQISAIANDCGAP